MSLFTDHGSWEKLYPSVNIFWEFISETAFSAIKLSGNDNLKTFLFIFQWRDSSCFPFIISRCREIKSNTCLYLVICQAPCLIPCLRTETAQNACPRCSHGLVRPVVKHTGSCLLIYSPFGDSSSMSALLSAFLPAPIFLSLSLHLTRTPHLVEGDVLSVGRLTPYLVFMVLMVCLCWAFNINFSILNSNFPLSLFN